MTNGMVRKHNVLWFGSTMLLPAILVPIAAGCIRNRPPTTQPTTAVDSKQADPEYWLAQPAAAQVTDRDFNTLWDTCEDVARAYLFRIDRRDYRAGRLTTEPMVSKQIFEVWRKDAGTFRDTEEDTLSTIRRTIHFRFAQNPDGSYTVAPKVVMERQAKVDVRYRQELEDQNLPTTYWYALRRDKRLEQKLVDSIYQRLLARSPASFPEKTGATPSVPDIKPGTLGG